jgi:hypothetical protein
MEDIKIVLNYFQLNKQIRTVNKLPPIMKIVVTIVSPNFLSPAKIHKNATEKKVRIIIWAVKRSFSLLA